LQEEILMGRWRHPCLSLHGIEGAFSGPGGKTVIPRKVIGKFSVRTVPNQTIEKVEKLVLDHIEGLWKARRSPNKMKVGTKCTDGNLLLKKRSSTEGHRVQFYDFLNIGKVQGLLCEHQLFIRD
jgi:acetylornithine deacetylase/succinyl-diaminopimelate desuccinylase-like protein